MNTTKLVLIIDDDIDDATRCSEQLITLGCRVLVALTAEQGARIAKLARPDVAVVHMRMPLAAEAVTAIRNVGTKVVLGVTSTGSLSADVARRAGCHAIQPKAVMLGDFERTMRGALACASDGSLERVSERRIRAA